MSCGTEVPQPSRANGYWDTQRVREDCGDGVVFEGDVDIFKNPTAGQVGRMMREHGMLRGYYDTSDGSAYLWDGSALHHLIEAPGDCWLTVSKNEASIDIDGESAIIREIGDHDLDSWARRQVRLKAIIGARALSTRIR